MTRLSTTRLTPGRRSCGTRTRAGATALSLCTPTVEVAVFTEVGRLPAPPSNTTPDGLRLLSRPPPSPSHGPAVGGYQDFLARKASASIQTSRRPITLRRHERGSTTGQKQIRRLGLPHPTRRHLGQTLTQQNRHVAEWARHMGDRASRRDRRLGDPLKADHRLTATSRDRDRACIFIQLRDRPSDRHRSTLSCQDEASNPQTVRRETRTEAHPGIGDVPYRLTPPPLPPAPTTPRKNSPTRLSSSALIPPCEHARRLLHPTTSRTAGGSRGTPERRCSGGWRRGSCCADHPTSATLTTALTSGLRILPHCWMWTSSPTANCSPPTSAASAADAVPPTPSTPDAGAPPPSSTPNPTSRGCCGAASTPNRNGSTADHFGDRCFSVERTSGA